MHLKFVIQVQSQKKNNNFDVNQNKRKNNTYMQQLFISERDKPAAQVCLQHTLVMLGLLFTQTDSLSLVSVHLSYII